MMVTVNTSMTEHAAAETMDTKEERSFDWKSETLFFSGDEYFSAIEKQIQSAQKSIDIECYIFSDDEVGREVARLLCEAAQRGVKVRVLVDGIGSPGWRHSLGAVLSENGVETRVFHEPFWERLLSSKQPGEKRMSLLHLMRRMNQRNHRKLFLFDGLRAFLGGMNIWNFQLERSQGAKAWRDTAVCVEGRGVETLALTFTQHWEGRLAQIRRRVGRRIGQGMKREKLPVPDRSGGVLANTTRYQRRNHHRMLLSLVEQARGRLWITTPYFVPPRKLLKQLCRAAVRGADVRLLVSAQSDVFFMPWASEPFYLFLLQAGAKVFQYQPRVLHAKTTLGETWALVGSSNMNHRSILHDLEVDVLLSKDASLAALAEQFLIDQSYSHEITIADCHARPLWRRLLSRLVLLFRVFL